MLGNTFNNNVSLHHEKPTVSSCSSDKPLLFFQLLAVIAIIDFPFHQLKLIACSSFQLSINSFPTFLESILLQLIFAGPWQ